MTEGYLQKVKKWKTERSAFFTFIEGGLKLVEQQFPDEINFVKANSRLSAEEFDAMMEKRLSAITKQ